LTQAIDSCVRIIHTDTSPRHKAIGLFLADRTSDRTYATVLHPSVCRLSGCDVMYCG